ncbi:MULTISPECIES: DUF2007 domain-containing protein [Vibrio]|uniref:RanBP2-type domain-containing protein n=1 Tax=Vibrio bivalvicida TaxID=1276888 RepID=A0A177Y507_9VIBR|nr:MULTISPECIES: DUF2007 domain-containing protein [Vibrio]KLN63105.1 hypothetical protein ZX61_22525 [Vibrio sp. VPAP30]OAJ95953.1 hypothetical protein APB76_02340 [Vibrio bivalvicida]
MRIYSASTPTEAHIVCELLKSCHIECEVRGEGVFGLQGEVPFGESSEPYIWLLNHSQIIQANAVIKEFRNAQIGSNWNCSNCGESNESQFGACWQCGETAP